MTSINMFLCACVLFKISLLVWHEETYTSYISDSNEFIFGLMTNEYLLTLLLLHWQDSGYLPQKNQLCGIQAAQWDKGGDNSN